MTTESLTGVWGAARRYRAQRNTGGPTPREVAALGSAQRRKRCGASEGSTVPLGFFGQQNRGRGKGPWFGVRLTESRGGRLA